MAQKSGRIDASHKPVMRFWFCAITFDRSFCTSAFSVASLRRILMPCSWLLSPLISLSASFLVALTVAAACRFSSSKAVSSWCSMVRWLKACRAWRKDIC